MRHHPVGDQNRRIVVADDLPGRLTVRSDDDFVPHFLQHPPQKQGRRRLVFRDQYLHAVT